ncbi:P-loop containing nucleoside triphosphate hydrolase protein [Byssothecium circinans]|uniref:P-loop containing nucleoside triphosphate hydrolase protein n=1 Tax=Byssothecium circinans TaxID=147558 RepID=A0A6A5U5N4_9PLEO|nr:P-loop containing nucleoside triphosphate hydrolase protein [Byssothecium circinans]
MTIAVTLIRVVGLKIPKQQTVDVVWGVYWQYVEVCIGITVFSATAFRTFFVQRAARNSAKWSTPRSHFAQRFRQKFLKRPEDTEDDSSFGLQCQIPGGTITGLRTFINDNGKTTNLETTTSGIFRESEDGEPLQSPEAMINPQLRLRVISSLLEILWRLLFHPSMKIEGPPTQSRGVSFRSVNAFAFATRTDYQRTFGNFPLAFIQYALSFLGYRKQKRRVEILQNCEGLVRSGEMLLVLGRPGAGCSTLLRTIAGETKGFDVGKDAYINYQGISAPQMDSRACGECIYQAELDVHFPTLTTCETVMIPVEARGTSKKNAREKAEKILEELGLSHTRDTKVGNEEIPGISGGERKRLSIAEVLACSSSLQCWDNSTRGLDSVNSLQFMRAIRDRSSRLGTAVVVSLYQTSDNVFRLFDKVCILHEGHLIYFGPLQLTREYFERLGFIASKGETEAEFLTSVTNPVRRHIRPEYEQCFPRTAAEMAETWKGSLERAELLRDMAQFEESYPLTSANISVKEYQAPITQQIALCVARGFIRIHNDLSPPISNLVGNCILGIVLGTVFLDLPNDTSSFFARSSLLFFATLLNAFVSGFEPGLLWVSRPIVEKHYRYALYKPVSEAIASMVTDLPNKFLFSVNFNVPIYFLTNLRRTGSAFCTFWFFSFACLLIMSMLFRTIGSWCSTLAGSMAPAAIFMLLLMIYSGFPLPSLMINEFSGREFRCGEFVPRGSSYDSSTAEKTCNVVRARPGQPTVLGEDHIRLSYAYSTNHLWRNFGILCAIMLFACALHLFGAAYATVKKSRGEVLWFKDRKLASAEASDGIDPRVIGSPRQNTTEGARVSENHGKVAICWNKITFDVKAGKAYKRLLDEVDGWIEHGTLTALVGESGAGKTTLLNVLAGRAAVGIVRGDMLINPAFASDGYARNIGYAQQMDIHLPSTTVREALQFSAMLRQPRSYTQEERLSYVEDVICSLGMEKFAEAIVGIAGEGLNVEQRKRFTIGAELAARPKLLLFLDEPTSGLDSDTAWAICSLLRRLADEGQAILCTVHQPSESLFSMFDRLLLLRKGRCIYFGDIGANSQTVNRYFKERGAATCAVKQNPAEWLMEVTASPTQSVDWGKEWERSTEKHLVQQRIQVLCDQLHKTENDDMKRLEFATSSLTQLRTVTSRLFKHFWRTHTYLYSKAALCLGSALVIGFSFWFSPNTLQGIQNEIFAIFLLMTIFTNLDQQIIPQFTNYRSTKSGRGPNFIVEIAWQTLMSVILFVCWYYPIGMQRNGESTCDIGERSGVIFLFIWSFMQFTLSLSYLVVAGMKSAATAVNIAQLLYSLSLIFCGVLAKPSMLPRFWKFMYRVTPLTYYTSGLISASLGDVPVQCSAAELQMAHPNQITQFTTPRY